jgi:putative ABC transport system permease protein
LSNQVGKDKLLFQSKGTQAPGIDDSFFLERKEIDFLGTVNGVKESVGVYIRVAEVDYKNEKKFVFLSSLLTTDNKNLIEESFNLKLEKGRKLKKGDKFKMVLGHNYLERDKIFSKQIDLRDKIDVNGQSFEVVGFYESVGNPQDDSNVYLTEEAVELLIPETKNKFQFAVARTEQDATAELAGIATEKLRKFKNLEKGKEDFTIETFDQAIEAFNNILAVLNGILVLIVFISLLVAGINIMNTMYTAVIERTKEIGVMKAVGAKNKDIAMIFLVESGTVGLIGGILGLMLGFGIAKLGGYIAIAYGYSFLQPIFQWWIILGCIIFAVLLGGISGVLPALNAAKLKPVDALRYQ